MGGMNGRMYFEIGDFNALRAALHEMCLRFSAEKIPEEAVFQSRLVADELLSNVLQHGGGKAFFSVVREGETIAITVRGASGFRPPEKSNIPADLFAERGRGLYLVDAFCESREYSEKDGIRVLIKILSDG